MVEPLACCLRGVERAEVEQGDRVAILGAGPIGLMLVRLRRGRGRRARRSSAAAPSGARSSRVRRRRPATARAPTS